MKAPTDSSDPIRDLLVYGEQSPVPFVYWRLPELLRRVRIRFGLRRWQLAALAGLSPSVVGRAERGADLRLSTLAKIFGAVGCRPVIIPAGASYELDWRSAHLDDAWLEGEARREREEAEGEREMDELLAERKAELQRNADSAPPRRRNSTKR